jgi:hypothetical protein
MQPFVIRSKILVHWTVVAYLVIGSACDKIPNLKKEKKEEETGELALTPEQRIVGEWRGFYRSLDENGKPLGESQACNAVFSDLKEFSLWFTEDASAKAEGEWGEFGESSLFLIIKKSTISRLRVSDAAMDSEYDLSGNYFLIKGEGFEIKLTRKPTTEPQGPNAASDPLTGRWNCRNNDILTALLINNDFRWRANVTNNGLLKLAGRGERLSPRILELTTESTNSDSAMNAVLLFEVTQDGPRLTIPRSGDNLGSCAKG